MENVVMNTIRIKACGEFVIGKYRTRKDVLGLKDIREEQIMSALGKSKTFNVRDWFGGTDTHTFAIVDIEKTKYGDYIYTIKCDDDAVPTSYFPDVRDIVDSYNTIAYPVSYSVISD